MCVAGEGLGMTLGMVPPLWELCFGKEYRKPTRVQPAGVACVCPAVAGTHSLDPERHPTTWCRCPAPPVLAPQVRVRLKMKEVCLLTAPAGGMGPPGFLENRPSLTEQRPRDGCLPGQGAAQSNKADKALTPCAVGVAFGWGQGGERHSPGTGPASPCGNC